MCGAYGLDQVTAVSAAKRGRIILSAQLVHQLHDRSDRRVELEAAVDVVGHLRDRRDSGAGQVGRAGLVAQTVSATSFTIRHSRRMKRATPSTSSSVQSMSWSAGP